MKNLSFILLSFFSLSNVFAKEVLLAKLGPAWVVQGVLYQTNWIETSHKEEFYRLRVQPIRSNCVIGSVALFYNREDQLVYSGAPDGVGGFFVNGSLPNIFYRFIQTGPPATCEIELYGVLKSDATPVWPTEAVWGAANHHSTHANMFASWTSLEKEYASVRDAAHAYAEAVTQFYYSVDDKKPYEVTEELYEKLSPLFRTLKHGFSAVHAQAKNDNLERSWNALRESKKKLDGAMP